MNPETHFLLNDREVRTREAPGLLVLDFLRRRERATGTKEGCREGDCGACAVLVGELEDGRLRYLPVTSCLMPLGELDGKHLVTVEGLDLGHLSPVQQAIVDEGATQCGFCTPGIVVSLTGLLMQDGAEITPASVRLALSGHLCRCTGYRSLKRAGEGLAETVEETGVEALVEAGVLPAYFRGVRQRLEELARESAARPAPEETPRLRVAGGTDLYVQRGEEIPEGPVEVLGLRPGMRGVERRNGDLRVGALTSFEDFAAHPEVRRIVPDMDEYMFLIASWQIRNRATVGGNLINASPIGDVTVMLLALDARLVLESGGGGREVPLRAFYKGYKKLDLRPDEVLVEVLVPVPTDGTQVHFEKVSKRTCLDIATVNSAVVAREEDGRFADVGLAAGGVAPVPLYLRRTGEALRGEEVSPASVERALAVAQEEIAPISDVRGSAAYKRLLVRQLLVAHFTRLYPGRLRVEDFHGAR